ncbi:Dabb family protein [Actinocorallia libanotica]|uniref:Stress-response A/B barrel domain-containing protein n=1 Tax=Actinocorallia libanotica TaxID=46162 RepID=A0ABN1Q1N9_9ACTN
MMRHIVLLQWTETATDQQKREAETAFHNLPARIPEILDFFGGSDRGLTGGAHDFAAVFTFADVEGWRAYQDHEAHKALVADHLKPILAGRAVIQFDD